MKTLVPMLLALLLSAGAASAQVSFNIGDCSANTMGAALNNVATNACTSNWATVFAAYCSMVMPSVTCRGFAGATGLIDVSSSVDPLPDWWRSDTCRPNGFQFVADYTIGLSCATPWDLVSSLPGFSWGPVAIYGVHGANTIRFVLSRALAETEAFDLTGDGVTELSVFKFTVNRVKSVGTGSCWGCVYGACLVLNEINLQTLTDTPATYLRLSGPLAGALDYITYNASAQPCPLATPVRNRTWGAIKALYR